MIDKIRVYTRDAGRESDAIGIEGRIAYDQGSTEAWQKELEAWQDLGATHLSFNTMKAGLNSPSAHIEAIRRFARCSDKM